jgi:hypothetical protein
MTASTGHQRQRKYRDQPSTHVRRHRVSREPIHRRSIDPQRMPTMRQRHDGTASVPRKIDHVPIPIVQDPQAANGYRTASTTPRWLNQNRIAEPVYGLTGSTTRQGRRITRTIKVTRWSEAAVPIWNECNAQYS